MSKKITPKEAFTPKKIRRSIKLDRVDPVDFLKYNLTYCCEQCSHYSPSQKNCTLGYVANNHLKEEQLKKYNIHGHMAFCRFLEID